MWGRFQVGKDVDQEPLFFHDGIVGSQSARCQRPPQCPDLRFDHRLGCCGDHGCGQVQELLVAEDPIKQVFGCHARRRGGDR